ncbi:MAG: hypothetical protein AVDCRST_MAG93-7465, partial [uncultured Chloroflexia bacterium]
MTARPLNGANTSGTIYLDDLAFQPQQHPVHSSGHIQSQALTGTLGF